MTPDDIAQPTLYGSTDSGHSYKVRLFLLLAGVPHTYRWIDLGQPRAQRDPGFVQASAFGEVPVWVDAEGPLAQSNAILMHLAQRHGRLAGASPREWALATQWLGWEANRIGLALPNLRLALRWAPQPPEVLAWLRQRLIADLATLDTALAGRDWLVGAQPTMADLANAAYLWWLPQAGLSLQGAPHIAAWLARIEALPGWQHPDQALQAAASS